MRFVATVQNNIITSKGINYTDYIDKNEIELTEEQYNNIPIPCRLVDGEFIPCNFPEVDIGEENPCVITQTQLVTYVGTGKSGADNPCSITCSFAPKIVQMIGFVHDTGAQFSTHSGENPSSIQDVIFCDKLNTEYAKNAGFIHDTVSSISRHAKKSADGKTISWYIDSTSNASAQYNIKGTTYYVLAMG